MTVTLPAPDPIAKAMSDRLLQQIQWEIEQKGPMLFSRFMTQALYAPELGYYRNPFQKFGKAGDFVTAPELSSLYSYCIANQCAQILEKLNGGDIIEFGAGSGVMAADILIALQKINLLPTHYYIIELSATLKLLQRETILKKVPELLDRVVWLNQLPTEKINGVILANEVLDAMPVELFTWQDGPKDNCVDYKNHELILIQDNQINLKLKSYLDKYEINFQDNYTSEINLMLSGWISSISDMLASGLILIIDYGFTRAEYYHPDRNKGTLMCHFNHHAHSNPLVYPGIQDITAHVDFTHIAEAASDNSLDVAGFTNQANFLINCDLLSLIDNSDDEITRINQNQTILQLTSPNEMGELFKVIGLTKNMEIDLLGFQNNNQLVKL